MAFPRVGKLAGMMVAEMASSMVFRWVVQLVEMMDNLLEEQMVHLSGFSTVDHSEYFEAV